MLARAKEGCALKYQKGPKLPIPSPMLSLLDIPEIVSWIGVI